MYFIMHKTIRKFEMREYKRNFNLISRHILERSLMVIVLKKKYIEQKYVLRGFNFCILLEMQKGFNKFLHTHRKKWEKIIKLLHYISHFPYNHRAH